MVLVLLSNCACESESLLSSLLARILGLALLCYLKEMNAAVAWLHPGALLIPIGEQLAHL